MPICHTSTSLCYAVLYCSKGTSSFAMTQVVLTLNVGHSGGYTLPQLCSHQCRIQDDSAVLQALLACIHHDMVAVCVSLIQIGYKEEPTSPS